MNANWLINTILRRVIGRLVNRGVDAGFRAMSDQSKGGRPPPSDEERAEREHIRAMRQARRAKRNSNS